MFVIKYSLSYIWCPYYNTWCPYSEMGTEYGHHRNYGNK